MIMLGILSLDTAFQRIPGDVGNPDSYPFAAQVRVVRGADSTAVVKDGIIDEALLQSFIAAAVALEKQGASAIVSTCGFLITAQSRIAAAVQIPVMLSALSMYPVVHATTPGRIGILTASQSALGRLHWMRQGPICPMWSSKECSMSRILPRLSSSSGISSAGPLTGRPWKGPLWPPHWTCRPAHPICARLSSNVETCRPMRRPCVRQRACQSIICSMLRFG